MSKAQASILKNSGNFAVVQMPDRNYPAMVVPGDSLHILCQDMEELVENLVAELGSENEAVQNAKYILESLQERRSYYEEVLHSCGIELPYGLPPVLRTPS